MNGIFAIGDFCFRVIGPDNGALSGNFMKFRGGDSPSYTYTMTLTEAFPAMEGQVVARREDMLVLRCDGRECRYIGVRGNPRPYARYLETGPDGAQILVASDQLACLEVDPMAASLFALERRMLDRDGLILHCAYVEYMGEAILFSAPSGTGKTTQANLWASCRGAVTVNGDRALLQRINGRWHARGWPVCGSSGVCENRDVPIRAIVMLSQASTDKAEGLSPMKAFTQLYSQVTVNRWNKAANLRAMELLEELISRIPVYHLACTMEPSAVEALESVLNGAEAHHRDQ